MLSQFLFPCRTHDDKFINILPTMNRVLVVEDEPDIREAIQCVLESEGFEVHCAPNGKEALSMLKSMLTPDVILLDILMPIMNGREFRTAQMNTDGIEKIPVLVMSADNNPAKKIGEEGLAVIKKPLDADDLISAVKRAVRMAASHE
jgi:CheY-like chemotaxis protein